MSELKALIFDVDGTLADTERDGHREAFNRAFAQAGLDWHWSVELYAELLQVTGGKERIKHYLALHHPEFTHENLDQFVAELHQAKTRFYTELLSTGKIPLRPGVKRVLNEARNAGIRLAIATTTTPDNVYALLDYAVDPHAREWFEVIAAGDIVPKKKPAADIYEYTLEKMQLAPEECLAFEDSENGIKSSLGAGIATVIVVNGYTYEHDFSGALIVSDDFGEPDSPFTVIEGDAGDHKCMDLDLMRELHAKAGMPDSAVDSQKDGTTD